MSWIDKLKDLHDRVTAARAGKLDYLQNLENGIYFDSALGSTGTTWPKGEPQDPSNTIADIITMCAARKTKIIYGCGTVTLGATMEGYTFIGINQGWTIDLNSQDVDTTHFYNCTVTGVQGGTGYIYCHDCVINGLTGSLYSWDCSFIGTLVSGASFTPRDGSINRIINPKAVTSALTKAYIDLAGITSVDILLFGACGVFGLKNSTNVNNNVIFNGIDGAYFYSDVSNTAGVIEVFGHAIFLKGSGGATESDHTFWGRLGAPAGASVSADIAAIKTVADAAAADAATAAALIGALNNLAAGAKMDLIDAPNATAIIAIQLGLAKSAELISGAAVDFGAVAKASIQAAAQAAITASSLALASNCDAKSSDIKAKTDKITLPIHRMVFKSADSAMLASLAFSNVAADKDFPSVVATAKPTGATVTKAYWGFSYSKKVNSSGGANAVSAANKAVRVKVSTGAWGTDDIVAYTFANGTLSTPASATEGGFMPMGSVDIKSVVDGAAATYNFRSEETNRSDALTVTGASLTFYDVESWLIVEYTL